MNVVDKLIKNELAGVLSPSQFGDEQGRAYTPPEHTEGVPQQCPHREKDLRDHTRSGYDGTLGITLYRFQHL